MCKAGVLSLRAMCLFELLILSVVLTIFIGHALHEEGVGKHGTDRRESRAIKQY